MRTPKLILLAPALLLLAACPAAEPGGGGGSDAGENPTEDGGGGETPKDVAVVDAAVTPFVETVAGVDGAPERPLAAVRTGDSGPSPAFVADELVVTSYDPAAAQDLADRFGGTILETIDLSENEDLAGLAPRYRVRVDASRIDPGTLPDDLAALAPDLTDTLHVSSEAGLALLAAAARLQREGVKVDLNWVFRPFTFNDRTTEETPLAGGGNADAFSRVYLKTGGPQDTGATEAWIALERAGKLGNTVRIGVIDGGFKVDADFPTDRRLVSRTGGFSNAMTCSGGTACPWHGTGVIHVAMAQVDNGYGTAGVAGPVAALEARKITTTVASVIAAFSQMGQARIINMSFGGEFSTTWQFWTLDDYREVVSAMARSRLLFAAAGNDNKSNDNDHLVQAPCELGGVICVGALGDGTSSRASYSSWGHLVDLWAPGTNITVPDPANPGSVKTVSGTSSASPFAAGVAALVWAADPSLTNDEVWELVKTTAHTGSSDAKVTRWVNARAAVLAALGDVPPYLEIVQPAPDATAGEGEDFTFVADLDDLDTPVSAYTVQWGAEDANGVYHAIGSSAPGQALTANPLCAGDYTVRAEALDSGAAIWADATVPVHVTVTPGMGPPCGPAPDEVTIDQPVEGAVLPAGQTVTLKATVNHDPPLHDVVWTEGPTIRARGLDAVTKLGAGAHTLTATYGTASDTVNVTVAQTANTPPTVSITQPADGASFTDFSNPPMVDVAFTATASDAEDGTLTGASLHWWVRRVGDTTWQDAGKTGTAPTLSLMDQSCNATDYEVRVVAQDAGGMSGEDVVTVSVFALGC